MTMFEGLADKDHVLYAWRGISSYFICFLARNRKNVLFSRPVGLVAII